jgi:HJR/Mrr/RecB family endonuclease
VVRAVCDHLTDHRWEIVSRATATEHGVDIVATRDGARLEVEAKGAGSSKPHTARYGRTFNRGQVL